jgi:lysophospholipase L1-like esterase
MAGDGQILHHSGRAVRHRPDCPGPRRADRYRDPMRRVPLVLSAAALWIGCLGLTGAGVAALQGGDGSTSGTDRGGLGAPPRVLILGDSVVEMICKYAPHDLDQLRRYLQVTCDGRDVEPYRSASVGPALIREHEGDFDDHLVLALGYNDGESFAERAEAIMEMPEVQAVPHVYWLTLRDVRGKYASSNEALAELSLRYDNLTLLDWNGLSTADERPMTRSDGVHLTDEGAATMAELITGALTTAFGRDRLAAIPWLSHPAGFHAGLAGTRAMVW